MEPRKAGESAVKTHIDKYLILNHDRFQQGYQNGRRYYFEDWSPEEQRKRQAECIVIHEAVGK